MLSPRFRLAAAAALLAPALLASSLAFPARARDLCAPVPPGLIAWWKLDGNGLDFTGNHNGAAVGTGSFVGGLVGGGYRSDGPGSLVLVPDSPAFAIQNFTMDAWVYVDSLAVYNLPVIWKGSPTGSDLTSPFALAIYGSTEKPLLAGFPFVVIDDGTIEQELDGPGALPLGTWVHLAATLDASTLTLYVNGVPVNSVARIVSLQVNSRPIQLASVVGSGALNWFSGIVDEVEIHSAAATPAQIQAIYEAGAAGKCPLITPARTHTWGEVRRNYLK